MDSCIIASLHFSDESILHASFSNCKVRASIYSICIPKHKHTHIHVCIYISSVEKGEFKTIQKYFNKTAFCMLCMSIAILSKTTKSESLTDC